MMKKFLFCLGVIGSIGISPLNAETNEVATGVLQIGTIENPAVLESSGLIMGRRTKGFYWTHNDSGADFLYGMTASGTPAGQYKLKNADLQDIEDIAYAAGKLYLADIGNNSGIRDKVYVHSLPEPKARLSGEVALTKQWELGYPDAPFDAESLVLSRGYGYVISKELKRGEAPMFRFPLRRTKTTLEEQCRLIINAPPTGADLTSDNRRLAVITEVGAYLFLLNRRIPAEGALVPALFVPFAHPQMEGCTFTSEGLLVTSESRNIFLFTNPMFRLGWKAPRR